MKSIDWRNHFVAFLSALVGILIAFRLEDHRENMQEEDKLEIAYELVVSEIENNIDIYEYNVNMIRSWLAYHDNIIELASGKVDQVIVTKEVYDLMTMQNEMSGRLSTYHVNTLGDTAFHITPKKEPIPGYLDIHFDFLPKTGVSTSAWQAGINSGVFTQLPPDKLSRLTAIFNWTNNDLGRNEYEIFEYGIRLEREMDEIDKLVSFYKTILNVQEFKLNRIKPLYQEVRQLE